MGSLGGNLLIDDLEAVAKVNDLCNRYGLDTIPVGQVIGFAFETWERGLIGPDDTGGLVLEWGSAHALCVLVEAIGESRGIGAILGQGLKRARRTLAPDVPELDLAVGGMELPSHDPRAFASIALGYLTSPRGACHLQAYSHGLEAWLAMPELGFPEILDRFSPDRKAELTVRMQNLMCLFDSLKMCKFVLYAGIRIRDLLDWLKAVNGWELTVSEALRLGEEIFQAKVRFNRREGYPPEENTLPPRFAAGPIGRNLAPMREEYRRLRGWS
jgi:aldehyde:ferredoxin oxidoreductase